MCRKYEFPSRQTMFPRITSISDWSSVSRRGAGLGTRKALVQIHADGATTGQFNINPTVTTVSEGQAVELTVSRDYNVKGAVSVTLTPIAGTATAGDDFASEVVPVSWGDGESGLRTIAIDIVDDALAEGAESFSVELSAPTGGAILGPHRVATITIAASDQPVRPPPPMQNHGGGGALGFLSLLLLGLADWLRSVGRAIRPGTGNSVR